MGEAGVGRPSKEMARSAGLDEGETPKKKQNW